MDTIAEDARLPVNLEAQTVVQAAATLRPVLRRYDEEIEREQHLPKAVVAHLLASGAYQMLIPRALGGLQVDPLTYLRRGAFGRGRRLRRLEHRQQWFSLTRYSWLT